MLALMLFATAMIFLTQVVQDTDDDIRSKILATQITEKIAPLLHNLNQSPDRLQSRFILAVIKKSLDVYDQSLDAKMAVYDVDGQLLVQTENSELPKFLPEPPSLFVRSFPALSGATKSHQTQVESFTGYTLLFELRESPKEKALAAQINLVTGTLLLLLIMTVVLWWISRSMTWRLNQLSNQITQLGEGDLTARVTVKGKDEIATLAQGFNQSAEKIEKLINANNLLLAHASHEIRTPITRIRLQVEMMDMLANKLEQTDKVKFDNRAKAINKDLTGLNDLIESILLVSRLDAGHALQKAEQFNLNQLVQQEVQHYPEVTLFGEDITITGQPKLLTHLVRNLLNNAMIHGTPPIKVYIYGVHDITNAGNIPTQGDNSTLNDDSKNNADKPKSPVKPSVFNKINPPSAGIKLMKMARREPENTPYSHVAIAVIDQGTGIAMDKRESIFSPFVRLQQEKKGSGLGLSLVAQIVESHQGNIITDTWNDNTRFLVTLPLHANSNSNSSVNINADTDTDASAHP